MILLLHRLFVRAYVRAGVGVRDLHGNPSPVATSTADSCMISRGPNGHGRSHDAAESKEEEKMRAKENTGSRFQRSY
jgi:hypothetical protein